MMVIQLTAEQKILVKSGYDIYRIIRAILRTENVADRDKEHVWVIGLRADRIVEYVELVSLGNHTASLIAPDDCLWLAVSKRIKNIVVCHNHPSEKAQPSKQDIHATARLIKAAQIIGITVIDHLIITKKTYHSIFSDPNTFEALEYLYTFAGFGLEELDKATEEIKTDKKGRFLVPKSSMNIIRGNVSVKPKKGLPKKRGK